MKRLLQLVHHRSLTASVASLLVAFAASGFIPEHRYRIQQQGMGYLAPAACQALLGWFICALTLFILIRDNRSGYPSFRLSLATLLRALACAPILFLTVVVVSGFLK